MMNCVNLVVEKSPCQCVKSVMNDAGVGVRRRIISTKVGEGKHLLQS